MTYKNKIYIPFLALSLCLILFSSSSAFGAFQWIPSHPLQILPLTHQDNKTKTTKTTTSKPATLHVTNTKSNSTSVSGKKITVIPRYQTPINNSTFIGIMLSKSCLTDLTWGLKTKCPTYKTLVPWDNTLQKFSGYFVMDNGFFHRMPAKYKNHYSIYDYLSNKTIIAVDPDYEFIKHTNMKVITIEGSDFSYADPSFVVTNATRFVYDNAYINNCQTATMSWNNQTLSKIINYLKSNCITTIIPTKVVMNQTKTDYHSSHTYKWNQWIADVKSNVTKSNCAIHKCDVKPIDRNW